MRPTKRRRGDRKDGWLIRSLDPFYRFTPFIMKTRNDASNYFSDTLELSEAEAYIRKKREEGYAGFGMLHLFVAAYVRTVSQRPWINRFISGQRIYARNNIEVCMAVKKEMTSESEETTIKMEFEPSDTALDVYNKLNAEVSKYRDAEDENENATLNVAGKLIKLPRFLLRWAISFIGWLDYHGKLPKSLMKASPFHGSMFITNLASLGIPPVYHHLYNFGNIPVFLALGARRKEYQLLPDGSVKTTRVLDFTVVSDERICDGFYFAKALKQFKIYVRRPEMLDVPPEKIVEDWD